SDSTESKAVQRRRCVNDALRNRVRTGNICRSCAFTCLAGPPLEHDPEKWIPVFGKDHAPTNKLERDGDSKKSHLALAGHDQWFRDQPWLCRRPATSGWSWAP